MQPKFPMSSAFDSLRRGYGAAFGAQLAAGKRSGFGSGVAGFPPEAPGMRASPLTAAQPSWKSESL